MVTLLYLSSTMLWNASVGTLRSLLLVTATFPSCPWNLTYHYKAFATSIYRFWGYWIGIGMGQDLRDGIGMNHVRYHKECYPLSSLYFVFYVISLRNHETGKFTTSRSVAALRNSFVQETKEEEWKPIGGTFMQIKKEKTEKIKFCIQICFIYNFVVCFFQRSLG